VCGRACDVKSVDLRLGWQPSILHEARRKHHHVFGESYQRNPTQRLEASICSRQITGGRFVYHQLRGEQRVAVARLPPTSGQLLVCSTHEVTTAQSSEVADD